MSDNLKRNITEISDNVSKNVPRNVSSDLNQESKEKKLLENNLKFRLIVKNSNGSNDISLNEEEEFDEDEINSNISDEFDKLNRSYIPFEIKKIIVIYKIDNLFILLKMK